MKNSSVRNTLFVEEAEILARERFDGDQVILHLAAPRIAKVARPGTFLHVRCDPALPMRRPLSLMGADPASGRLTILFKIVGKGTGLLAEKKAGNVLDVIGPIGNGFQPREDRPRALLLGGGAGMPPMVFLATRLAEKGRGNQGPILFMGSEVPFPFQVCPSRIPIFPSPLPPSAHAAEEASAAMAAMEALGIPSRLASGRGYNGVFNGFVTELAQDWLAAQPAEGREKIALYACGPEPMLRASAGLARRYGLPCQLCLEEFMACGVGACAGCVVPVTTSAGVAMKRVCVDGPVFHGREVFGE